MSSETKTVLTLKRFKVACGDCSLNTLCLPLGMAADDLGRLDAIIERKRPLARTENLYHCGEQFDAIYAVRSGSLKTYATSEHGEEQILGFHLPGELVGLDAIADGLHPLSAQALETTSVCEIPFDKLESLSAQLPSLQHQLLRLMSLEIHDDQKTMTALAQKSAEERLAAFLISLSTRLQQRGFSPNRFNLSMSRGDIANYLGLALETVSRVFTRMQNDGLLRVERKAVELLDQDRLYAYAGTPCPSASPQSSRHSS